MSHILNCHHPRKRVIQYSRDFSDRADRPRRRPVKPGDDGGIKQAAVSLADAPLGQPRGHAEFIEQREGARAG